MRALKLFDTADFSYGQRPPIRQTETAIHAITKKHKTKRDNTHHSRTHRMQPLVTNARTLPTSDTNVYSPWSRQKSISTISLRVLHTAEMARHQQQHTLNISNIEHPRVAGNHWGPLDITRETMRLGLQRKANDINHGRFFSLKGKLMCL